ncbi:MAG: Hsp70 family protein [Anaerolineaceae bacterium]|nr:Hsp70 family protein [Anaerolineaceae bacterium]
MPGRLAVDFGTSNTVLAIWNDQRKEGVPLLIPGYSHVYHQGNEQIAVIPSLIHYAADRRRWIGEQVLANNLYESERTFRWMKRYISHRSPIRVKINGVEISHADAGKEFLAGLLVFAVEYLNLHEEEVAFSVPVEAYEHYEEWLSKVAETAGVSRYRLIDEPSAAALGYGAHVLPGNVYLLFDFGGGTLQATVVRVEDDANVQSGRRCRVLGKAGREIGGASIDQWLFQEVLNKNHRSDMDDGVRPVSNALLVGCEQVKEKLTYTDQADLTVINPITGLVLTDDFTRARFEELLDRHDLYNQIDQTVRAAISSAREHGYGEDSISAALMVGGSSQIPSVQRTMRQIFGKERVLFDRPLDAVARGAAAYVAGVDFYDHIQHDYAIRFVNPNKSTYDYRPVVSRGTPYPTREPVARFTVKATYDGQAQLGIAIFEIGDRRPRGNGQALELVFDPSGAARVMPVSPDEQEHRSSFWMNENNPTFLSAIPPAMQGEPRYEVEFNIDGNKRLLISARDLKTGQLAYQDYPVVKLT